MQLQRPPCKVCFKPVTIGKLCGLCKMPVCGDHRHHVMDHSVAFGKRYYCSPPCGGVRQPSSQQQQQQQQQQMWQQQQQGQGQSTQPYLQASSSAQPPPLPQQSSPYLQQQTPPAQYMSPTQQQATTPQLGAPSVGDFGLCGGYALPIVPEVINGFVTVAFATGAQISVPEAMDEARALARPIIKRELRRGDCLEFVLSDNAQKRRGVVVGTVNGLLLVLERRHGALAGITAVASCIPSSQLPTVRYLSLGRCKHCGCLIPLDEASFHVSQVHHDSRLIDPTHGIMVGAHELLLALRPLRVLGEGAQGRVYLCPRPPNMNLPAEIDGPYFVLKEIRCQTPQECSSRYQQAVRLMELRNEHVIRYYAVQQTADSTMVKLVMPYLKEKDLAETIKTAKNHFTEFWICSILLQLAVALKYLHGHSPPILHGDIKPENVMMFAGLERVVLMDFDTSVELKQGNASTNSAVGTAEWMAPELANSGRCSAKSDVWSLGLLAYVLAVLPDFPMLNNGQGEELLLNNASWTASQLKQAIYPQIVNRGYSHGFATLVTQMMSVDEAQRPSSVALELELRKVTEDALLTLSSH